MCGIVPYADAGCSHFYEQVLSVKKLVLTGHGDTLIGISSGGISMARIIGFIVLGIIAVIILSTAISIALSIFGMVLSLIKILIKLAIFGAIIWFAWQVYERVKRQS